MVEKENISHILQGSTDLIVSIQELLSEPRHPPQAQGDCESADGYGRVAQFRVIVIPIEPRMLC